MDGHPAVVVLVEDLLHGLVQRQPLNRGGRGGEWLVVEHGPGACDQRLELAAAGVQVGQLLLGFCQCRLDGGAGFFEDLDEAELAILGIGRPI